MVIIIIKLQNIEPLNPPTHNSKQCSFTLEQNKSFKFIFLFLYVIENDGFCLIGKHMVSPGYWSVPNNGYQGLSEYPSRISKFSHDFLSKFVIRYLPMNIGTSEVN